MHKLGDIRGGYTLINDGNLPRLPQEPRPEGVHLSNILSTIFGYSNKVVPETRENQASFASSNLMELGVMFEFALKHRLKQLHPNRYIDPPTLYRDGVYMTPDLYDVERGAYPDIKFTGKSARACPGEEPSQFRSVGRMASWDMQVKAYTAADGCNVGQLMVCHVNGVYSWLNKQASIEEVANDDTVFNVWEKVYSDEELVANWAMIMASKGDVE